MAILALIGVNVAHSQQATTVEVGDFFFCDKSSASACETVVSSGDAVIWDYAEGSAGHTVTYCGESCDDPVDSPLFDSGKLLAGETFAFTFDEPGEYLYYCEFHPVAMRASILVQPQQTSPLVESTKTAEPSPAPPTGDAFTPGLTTTPTSPSVGPETAVSEDGGPEVWVIAPMAIVAALAVLGVSLFAFRRSRD